MKTSHVLEVSSHPYTLGNPRIYYAEDYAIGSSVVNQGIVWEVKYINGVCMFVSYEEEERQIAYLAKNYPVNLKPTYKVVKKDGVIVGYSPAIKRKSFGGKDTVLWEGDNIYPNRDLGQNSATNAARLKVLEVKSFI